MLAHDAAIVREIGKLLLKEIIRRVEREREVKVCLIVRRTAVCKPVLNPKIQSLSLIFPDRIALPPV